MAKARKGSPKNAESRPFQAGFPILYDRFRYAATLSISLTVALASTT